MLEEAPDVLFIADSDEQSADEVEEIIELRQTSFRVLRDLWSEFYRWEQEHCRQTLASLSRRPHHAPHPLPVIDTPWAPPSNTASNLGEAEVFWIEDINVASTERTRSVVVCEPVRMRAWKAHSRYTACTPASRCVRMQEMHQAPFAHYADDREFDLRDMLTKFSDFAWQNNYADPDAEIIHDEAARRLHFRHKFSYEDIDSLKIFPKLREPSNGLIWEIKQRDYLWWAGARLTDLPIFEKSMVDESLTLLQRLEKLSIPTFCGDLNCIMPYCGIHENIPPIVPAPPSKTVERLKAAYVERDPCGDHCYMSMDADNANMANTDWDEQDRALVKSCLTLMPDACPCDIAVISRKTCQSVFIERLAVYPDDDIESSDDERSAEKPVFVEDVRTVYDDGPMAIPAAGPCSHAGPCNRFATNCPCFTRKQRCIRGCRCSVKCERRFPGCKCHARKHKRGKDKEAQKMCGAEAGDACQCRLLLRAGKKKCHNRLLQLGDVTGGVHVKGSQYGLGAFALGNLAVHDLVGEYTGELAKSSAFHLEPLQKFVGLNYAFDYAAEKDPATGRLSEFLLDAWNLGNETRYLNHPNEGEEANCCARNILVNGMSRIGIFASSDIRAGAEITLNYGEKYWADKAAPKKVVHPDDQYDPINIQWKVYT